jgi:hypothetical protein
MNLGVIDKNEYRQHTYWQVFQKLLLPCAAGFSVAGALLETVDLRLFSTVVGAILWGLFLASSITGWLVARRMVRDLPASMQSLLLFSSDSGDEVRALAEGGAAELQ